MGIFSLLIMDVSIPVCYPAAMKVIFAGTPEFAVPSLEQLVHSHHNVVAVYTQPDRPAGRTAGRGTGCKQ